MLADLRDQPISQPRGNHRDADPTSSGTDQRDRRADATEKGLEMKAPTPRTAVAVLATTAGLLAAGQLLPAIASAGATTLATTGPTVYQGKTVNGHAVLGPQYSPTRLVQTHALPAGTYLITATVSAVIASHDQIVCATSVSGNDGVFGTAGNSGTGSIYGTATMTDTIHVLTGQTIKVTCNSFNFGLGTYAAGAVVEATPVAAVR